jgi:RIO-like serine/threonine protein kinase
VIDITLDGPERKCLEAIEPAPGRTMGRRALMDAHKVKPATLRELVRRELLEAHPKMDAYKLTTHGLAALGKIA